MNVVFQKLHQYTASIKTIYDIGCMDGRDSYELHNLYPDAKVYGIEGLKENYDKYLSNNTNPNITFKNVVVCDYNGIIDFYEKTVNGIHGIYSHTEFETKNKHTYPCLRMDTIIDNEQWSIPDLVKIDVEGASYEALKGFGDYLKCIKFLQIETEEYSFFENQHLEKDVLDLVKDNFIIVYKIHSSSSKNKNEFQNDYILINKENI